MGGGVVVDTASRTTLRDSVLRDNTVAAAAGKGGGYACFDIARTTFDNVQLVTNSVTGAELCGAGASFELCSGTLSDGLIDQNTLTGASAGVARGAGLSLIASDVVVENTTLSANSAVGGSGTDVGSLDVATPGGVGAASEGGGAFVQAGPPIVWTQVVFTDNTLVGGSGGKASPAHSTIVNGQPGCASAGTGGAGGVARGGGVFVDVGADLTLVGASATGNTVTGGAGGAGGSAGNCLGIGVPGDRQGRRGPQRAVRPTSSAC
jgi:hypothetical protein